MCVLCRGAAAKRRVCPVCVLAVNPRSRRTSVKVFLLTCAAGQKPSHQHGRGEPDSLVEVESRSRELALPEAHLDVTLARNGSPVGDVHVFKLAHASAQVAAQQLMAKGAITLKDG